MFLIAKRVPFIMNAPPSHAVFHPGRCLGRRQFCGIPNSLHRSLVGGTSSISLLCSGLLEVPPLEHTWARYYGMAMVGHQITSLWIYAARHENGSCRNNRRDGVVDVWNSRTAESDVAFVLARVRLDRLHPLHEPCSASTRSAQGPWLVAPLPPSGANLSTLSTSHRPEMANSLFNIQVLASLSP